MYKHIPHRHLYAGSQALSVSANYTDLLTCSSFLVPLVPPHRHLYTGSQALSVSANYTKLFLTCSSFLVSLIPPHRHFYAGSQALQVSADYTKLFLTVFEHPPDAHRGFDIPAAIITFLHHEVLAICIHGRACACSNMTAYTCIYTHAQTHTHVNAQHTYTQMQNTHMQTRMRT